MTFDIIVGNPPYNAPKKKSHTNRGKQGFSLWDKFILKVFEINPEYILFITPSRWRKYTSPLFSIMTNKQILYLSIHGYKDAMKIFKAETRYDWYLIHNKPAYQPAIIRDEKNIIHEIDTTKIKGLIPNYLIETVYNLIAEDEEKKTEILFSRSDYGTDKKHMSKTKDDKFIYPCVYYVNVKGIPTFYYSSVKKGHFGIPKVIIPNGGISVDYLIDKEGKYGMTQFCKAIVDEPEVLDDIYKAMMSDEFKDILNACSVSFKAIDKDILGLFRKDFWKDFL